MNEGNVSKALGAAIARLDEMDAKTGGLPVEVHAMKKTLEHIALASDARGVPEEGMEEIGRESVSLLLSSLVVSSLAGADGRDAARSIVDTIFETAANEGRES